MANIAGSLAKVSREQIIERSLGNFRSADKDFADRLAKAVKELRESQVERRAGAALPSDIDIRLLFRSARPEPARWRSRFAAAGR